MRISFNNVRPDLTVTVSTHIQESHHGQPPLIAARRGRNFGECRRYPGLAAEDAVIVNKSAYDALDPTTRQAVQKSAADAEARGWATSKAKNGEYLDLLKKNGMQIVAPPAQLKADMKKVGETMVKEWTEKSGTEAQQLVDAFRR